MKIKLTVGMNKAVMDMTKNDLLILDEADYHLLDLVKDLPAEFYGVIGMTATDVGQKGGNEEKRLEQLKMKVYQSKIASNLDLNVSIPKISIESFLDCNRNTRGRIIWCEDKDIDTFKLAAIGRFYNPIIN